ncbi:MAG: DUF6179 domain-containing protein [Candidatus Coprovivens sp.]
MKYNVTNIDQIVKNEVDYSNYVESLLNASLKYQIISKEEYEGILFKFISLLSILIKKYTGELSSSVKIEVAKNINNSNLWVIGLYLKTRKLNESIDILKNKDIVETYNYGKMILDDYISKTKFFYSMIKNNFIKNDNYFYNSTLKDGIQGFFKIYNESYDAKNICITADYEVFLERPKLYGIEFINKYLEYINYENTFCKKFNNEKIVDLLKKVYKKYEDLPINIFEIVFITSLLCEYQNLKILDLDVDKIDIQSIYDDFDTNRECFENNLKVSFMKLKDELFLKDNYYLNNCFNKLLMNIIFACDSKTLENLLGRSKIKEVLYYSKDKMNNEKYKELIKKIQKSESFDKIDFLLKNINSLLDLIDVLDDVDFSSDELFTIFSRLKTIDIMAMKKIFSTNLCDTFISKELNSYIITKNIFEQKMINDNYEFITIIMI